MGCTHWDSAALYGDSEELIGKWFQRTGKRGDVSKFPSKILTPSSQRLVLLTDGPSDIPGYQVRKPRHP